MGEGLNAMIIDGGIEKLSFLEDQSKHQTPDYIPELASTQTKYQGARGEFTQRRSGSQR